MHPRPRSASMRVMQSDTAPPRSPSTMPLHSPDGVMSVPASRDDMLAVTLFEDAAGRLVIVDESERLPRGNGPLLRIGRARIVLRHLGAPVMTRLLSHGHVVVNGADALNVLLAFAGEMERTPR